MPAWCRPCAKCLRSRRSWGCRGFFLSAFWRRCLWRRWCSGRCVACPPDLRPPRGLPARSPSAPRASLGASARSPARPRRPRGGLQSGGACGAWSLMLLGASPRTPARPRRRPRAPQPCPPVPPAPFTPVEPGVLMVGLVRRLASLMVLLVVPRVFWAPEGPAAREARASLRSAPRLEARPCPPVPPAPFTPVGPCVLACGSARPISKPGLDLPPPTGTAAWPSGPSGALHTCGALCVDVRFGALAPCLARHRRRPRAPQLAPSRLSGALHTGGAWSTGVGLARCPEARLWLSISNFARNSSMAHSNFEFIALELQRFWGVSKNDHDKLRAKCGWRWCRRRPWVPQPGLPSPLWLGRICLPSRPMKPGAYADRLLRYG